MKKMLKKRAGFTLVELLIVIIIIGILAGAMLLVAGSGTDKAEATKIISNLRSIKSASLLYYADKAGTGAVARPAIADLVPYMDRAVEGLASYDVSGPAASNDIWYSGFTNVPTGVAKKLADVAEATGLYKVNTGTDAKFTATDTKVYMRAR